MFGGNSFHPSDIKMAEDCDRVGFTDLSCVPAIEHLKNKLQEIFTISTQNEVGTSEILPEATSLENTSPHSVTLEDGSVIDLSSIGSCESITKTDDTGTIYFSNGTLEAGTTYELNGNTYTTDAHGRIIYCEATPERSPENPRDVNAQLHAGGEDRRPSDQGGHIVGRDLNGDGGVGNLVAMDSRINQSDYKRMENDIKNSLDDGKDVSLTADIYYPDDLKRPDIITITTTTDGVKTIYKFDNNLDGRLTNEVPENGKDVVNEEICSTNGVISSFKEEYDKSGNLSETTVNITYTDDNGMNYRTKVYIDAE